MFPILRMLLALSFLFSLRATPLEWKSETNFRWAPVAPAEGKTGFTKLSQEIGITFTNILNEWQVTSNRVLQNGSGVAIGDIDNDGWQDIFFCALDGKNALYKNAGGWKFSDIAMEAGVFWTNRICRGATFGDIDGDGDLDLLVGITGEGVICCLNDGKGKFTDATAAAGTSTQFAAVTMALADVDGNGTLDLYVANNRTDDIRDRGQINLSMVRGKMVVPPAFKDRLDVINSKVFEYGEPDFLYLNDGKGKFTAVSWTDGRFLDEAGQKLARPPLDWGLSVFMRDLNADGAPDIYVCNDYWTADRIYINDGKGNFREADNFSMRHISGSSMGADVADINRDGHYDIFVVDMLSRLHTLRTRQMPAQTQSPARVGLYDDRPQVLRNTLHVSRGDGTYAEVADFSGVSGSEWSWQPLFVDVDLDGYEDVLIPSGHIADVQDLDAAENIKRTQTSFPQNVATVEFEGKMMPFREAFVRDKLKNAKFYPRLETPIVAFRNLGNLQFTERTEEWGLNRPAIHHGASTGDLDNDGDQDLVVNNLGSGAGIYRNDGSSPRVMVVLRGEAPNTQGIGAHVKLLDGAVPMQSQEIFAGGRYQSGSQPAITFAAGKTASMTLEVKWRNGKESKVLNVAANRIYEVSESGAKTAAPAIPAETPTPLFSNVSDLLKHQHADEFFNDFDRQPLLPRRFSQLGPGVAWFDLNNDGFDDLVIGSGKGGQLALFMNNGKGGFTRESGAPLDTPLARDQTGILGWRDKNGQPVILAGSANYEDGLALGAGVRQFRLGEKRVDDSLPATDSSSGALALTDIDADGNLDLFVAGRMISGRYPQAASSRIFKGDGLTWTLDQANTSTLAHVGLVTGSVWTDLDNDGFSELALACEWGPIKVFKNDAGKLREITKDLGLDQFTGLWNGITAADLDGDGRMDLVAGNWGLNTPYRASATMPLKIFWGELAQPRRVDVIETEYEEGSKMLVPFRRLDILSAAIPILRERFPTHAAFSEASLEQFFPAGTLTNQIAVTTLASALFMNRGDRFEKVDLMMEAQLAPVFAIVPGDFDGDGDHDLFLSQNFFGNQADMARCDAGRGLLLENDGSGRLKPITARESGITTYGEQRGAAAGDFDTDGKLDLAVSQNGATTQLFQNLKAKVSLKVKLVGSPGNSNAVGASILPKTGTTTGPRQEIQAGSGYWSQNSSAVLAGPLGEIDTLEVRWPGGKTASVKVPQGALMIKIDSTGPIATP